MHSDQYKLVAAPFNSDYWDECRRIRVAVFVDEQKYPLEDEIDEHDEQCFHLLLLHRPVASTSSATSTEVVQEDSGRDFDGYHAAGTLRYFPPPKNKVGRVAVSKHFRGRGLGGVLMKGLEAMLREEVEGSPRFPGGKAKEINLNAQVPVVAFYKGLGYTTEGDEFQEDGTPHILMRKSLLPVSSEDTALAVDNEARA